MRGGTEFSPKASSYSAFRQLWGPSARQPCLLPPPALSFFNTEWGAPHIKGFAVCTPREKDVQRARGGRLREAELGVSGGT